MPDTSLQEAVFLLNLSRQGAAGAERLAKRPSEALDGLKGNEDHSVEEDLLQLIQENNQKKQTAWIDNNIEDVINWYLDDVSTKLSGFYTFTSLPKFIRDKIQSKKDWVKAKSKEYNRDYWWHKPTRKTSWIDPTIDSFVLNCIEPILIEKWESMRDKKLDPFVIKNVKTFINYHNENCLDQFKKFLLNNPDFIQRIAFISFNSNFTDELLDALGPIIKKIAKENPKVFEDILFKSNTLPIFLNYRSLRGVQGNFIDPIFKQLQGQNKERFLDYLFSCKGHILVEIFRQLNQETIDLILPFILENLKDNVDKIEWCFTGSRTNEVPFEKALLLLPLIKESRKYPQTFKALLDILIPLKHNYNKQPCGNTSQKFRTFYRELNNLLAEKLKIECKLRNYTPNVQDNFSLLCYELCHKNEYDSERITMLEDLRSQHSPPIDFPFLHFQEWQAWINGPTIETLKGISKSVLRKSLKRELKTGLSFLKKEKKEHLTCVAEALVIEFDFGKDILEDIDKLLSHFFVPDPIPKVLHKCFGLIQTLRFDDFWNVFESKLDELS